MKYLYLLFYFITTVAFGQPIIPQPAVIKSERGSFAIRTGLRVWASASCTNERQFLDQYWQEAGLPALTTVVKPKAAEIRLLVDGARYEALGQEGYELQISPRRISVAGASAVGVFHGLQTLRQLLTASGTNIPAILVRDKPRFGWRSFRLDEEQNSIGIVAVKKLLDELTLLKFNRLLWRIPPTNAAGQTQGGYTAGQLEEIRQYAQARRLKPVIELNPVVQKDNIGISPDYELFRSSATDTTTIYFWKGRAKSMLEAAQKGWNIVNTVCPETCLQQSITELPLDRTYAFDPIPDQLLEDLRPQILGVGYGYSGGQTTTPESFFTQLHPRLAAAAEVAWTFQQDKNWGRFQNSLQLFVKRWW
jgi:N-acetyl-beta-hexosaminidase